MSAYLSVPLPAWPAIWPLLVAGRALALDRARPAALKALRQLEDLGVLVAAGGGPRGQLRWRADEVLSVLTDEG